MNEGQKKFYSFITERTLPEKSDTAIEILSESFSKQNNGTFDKEYMDIFIDKILKLIKPENIDEVRMVLNNYRL